MIGFTDRYTINRAMGFIDISIYSNIWANARYPCSLQSSSWPPYASSSWHSWSLQPARWCRPWFAVGRGGALPPAGSCWYPGQDLDLCDFRSFYIGQLGDKVLDEDQHLHGPLLPVWVSLCPLLWIYKKFEDRKDVTLPHPDPAWQGKGSSRSRRASGSCWLASWWGFLGAQAFCGIFLVESLTVGLLQLTDDTQVIWQICFILHFYFSVNLFGFVPKVFLIFLFTAKIIALFASILFHY